MSRLVNRPIQVTLGPDGFGSLVPVSFKHEREQHRIREILDYWVMTGAWWEDAGAVGRAPGEAHFWRVQTTRGGLFEVVREANGEWRLWKAYD